MAVGNITVNQGTNSAILTDTAGTYNIGVVKVDKSAAGTYGSLFDGNVGVNSGTVNAGTVDLVKAGTVTRLEQGSVNVTAGTVNTGTVNTGTINTGTVNAGTINTGTINAGTIDLVKSGTITRVEQGSINVTAGTFRQDSRNTQNIITYGTQIVGTAAIAATIVGSASVGAGTSLWLNDVSIMNPYGSVLCVLGFGTAQQGTNVFVRGVFGTQTSPGIEKPYPKMVNAGMTNQDLVFSLGAAGTIDLSFSYLISA